MRTEDKSRRDMQRAETIRARRRMLGGWSDVEGGEAESNGRQSTPMFRDSLKTAHALYGTVPEQPGLQTYKGWYLPRRGK